MFRWKKERKNYYDDPIIVYNESENFIEIVDIPGYDTFFLETEGIIIQQFLDSIVQKEKCVIVGFFCDNSIDRENKKNIIRKLSLKDEKLIKKNKRREKHKMNFIEFFLLKNININSEFFEIPQWDFHDITIWSKKSFKEKEVLKIYNKYFYLNNNIKELENMNLRLTFSEAECLRLFVSKKFIKEAKNMLEAFQKMGYRISGKIE